jgi:galactose-1-phosphate uridylyltransferase
MQEKRSLEDIIKELPPDLKRELEDFAQFLWEKKRKKTKRKLKLTWAGALADLADKYTSVELQHKILDWMIEDK